MPNKIVAFAPLLLAVGGGVVYHLAAKSIPKSIDPSAALIGLYATALAGAVLTYAMLRSGPVTLRPAAYWNPTIAAVGLGALIIELGFLLAYRGAWPVSTASVIANALVAVILVPLGAVAFREPISLERAIGILLCLLGVTLLQR
jgi:drug/metabolite transporter (DMT)-like permease